MLFLEALLCTHVCVCVWTTCCAMCVNHVSPFFPQPPYHVHPLTTPPPKAADADAVLVKLAAASPDHALPASLLRAQAAAASGNLRGAVAVLKDLNEGPLRHRPGVVASVVGLLVHVGEGAEAEAVLQGALQHWQGQGGSDERYAGR